MPKDFQQVTGVLDAEVQAVPPKVLLPCLPHQMRVPVECFEVCIRFSWDGAPLGGEMSTGSGEGCCCLGLGKVSGAGEEEAMGAGICSGEEAPCGS